MDTIAFKKIYSEQPDSDLLELEITAVSKYVTAFQCCYLSASDLLSSADKIEQYLRRHHEPRYIQYGEKEGNFTPAFSMNILPADQRGHIKVEVDVEIADHPGRSHRCLFFVETELGMIERFGKQIRSLAWAPVGASIHLDQP